MYKGEKIISLNKYTKLYNEYNDIKVNIYLCVIKFQIKTILMISNYNIHNYNRLI